MRKCFLSKLAAHIQEPGSSRQELNVGKNQSDVLTAIRNAILFVAIYSYFVGWVYQYYFLRHFGVSLSIVEPSFQSFFVYSYSVFFTLYGALVVGCSLCMIWLVIVLCPRIKYATVLILIVTFPVLFFVARNEGERNAVRFRSGQARSIKFTLKQEVVDFYPSEFLKANKSGDLRLVVETKDRFVVTHQPKGEGGAMPYGTAYDIARAGVLLAEIALPTPFVRGGF